MTVIHFLLQYQGIIRPLPGQHSVRLTSAEKRLLLLIFYIIVLGAVALTVFAASTTVADEFAPALMKHFHDLSYGSSPNDTHKSWLTTPLGSGWVSWLTALQFFMIGTVPTVVLIFAVNWKVVFKTVIRCCVLSRCPTSWETFDSATCIIILLVISSKECMSL